MTDEVKKGIRIEGDLLEYEEKTLGSKQAFSVKVGEHLLTWWEMPAANEFNKKNPLGKKVVCIFTEKPNPKKPQYPYKNIQSLGFPEDFEVKTEEELKQETVGEPTSPKGETIPEPKEAEGYKEPWNPALFGMCSNQAMMKMQHQVQFNEEEYKALIRKIFKLNKELIKELKEE